MKVYLEANRRQISLGGYSLMQFRESVVLNEGASDLTSHPVDSASRSTLNVER
ncbi:hypothetical protein Fuma_00849 [Fuerstiella marisgermanici]|uniref:Uncharacterized protein n=1 Tax=Fuerstiella marisgermanici TaxID=1891926 RepID=A0A1P8WB52_9PLAN|nr:hypothetical protein Fuma_00849 [Fuerstiella marisgermanici]